ncbi:MAG: phosphodiester glycosidase family protein [Deltaproteobacteria bacterium]|nr:phosphodiester glycosidase family protein [Deltaproteobacteria bacterium]
MELALVLTMLAAVPEPFRTLEPGLELAELDSPVKSVVGDSRLTVVRVDPQQRKLRLLSRVLEKLPDNPDAAEWARLYELPAVVNAGMYQMDFRSTVGYSQVDGRVFNGAVHAGKNFQAYLAFDPREKGLAPVRILDPLCDDVKAELKRYGTALQSIRMVDCKGKNHWEQRKRKWSAALVGLDGKGRVLFIHARSPWAPTEFIDLLLGMKALDLRQAVYMEGGPEASLVVGAGGTSLTRIGSYESGFNENDDNHRLWALPNVLGVVKRQSTVDSLQSTANAPR